MEQYTVKDISLDGNFTVDILLSFSLHASINHHTIVKYRGIIQKDKANKYLSESVQDKYVRIAIDQSLLFCGIIKTMEILEESQVFYLEITAISYSSLMDRKLCKRSFQNVQMTYRDVFNRVSDEANSLQYSIFCFQGHDTLIGSTLLQYRETDWKFALRMASRLETGVVPNHAMDIPQISLGIPSGKKYTLQSNEYIIHHQYSPRFIKSFTSYRFSDKRIFKLGDRIHFQGMEYLVLKMEINLEHGLLQGYYEMGDEKAVSMPEQWNPCIAGLGLTGTVLAIDADCVKLHLDIDEEQDIETAFPFAFLPATGNGMYLMPQVGAKAVLEWQSERDYDAMITSSWRENGENCSDLYEYSRRYLTTEHGKRLGMLPEKIFFSGDFGNMTLHDRQGATMKSKRNIQITAHSGISFHSQKKICLETPQKVEISKPHTTSKMVVSGGKADFYSEKIAVFPIPNSTIMPPISVYRPSDISVDTGLALATLGLIPKYGRKLK